VNGRAPSVTKERMAAGPLSTRSGEDRVSLPKAIDIEEEFERPKSRRPPETTAQSKESKKEVTGPVILEKRGHCNSVG